MARRFIVDTKDVIVTNDIYEIFGNEVKHIQVLRHNIGDEITINDGIFKITGIKKESIVLEKVREAMSIGIPNINLTLYMAMLKNDKMDFVVQKAVELGVKNIVPFFSKNVVVKLDEKAKQKRREKLQIIANEACKQCGRSDIVIVSEFINFSELRAKAKEHEINIFAYENENTSLKEILKDCNNCKDISVIVGAEGGFDQKEAKSLKEVLNVKSVSLGNRILRAETAALNLLSIVIYQLEG